MKSEYRVMRLIVMFDLPVETKSQQKEYRKFHNGLLKNGFSMMQYSVYSRYCNNDTASEKYILRVKKIRPTDGNVRLLKVTENQFNNMILLVGERSARENVEKSDELIIID